MTEQKYKTKIKFNPSPEVYMAGKSKDAGKAGYRVRIFVNNVEIRPITLPPDATSVVIEGDVGEWIQIGIMPIDKNGTPGEVEGVSFMVTGEMPPQKVSNVRVERVYQPLKIFTQAEIASVEASFEPPVEVHGYRGLPDGAVGHLANWDGTAKQAMIRFEPAQFTHNTGVEVIFVDPYDPALSLTALVGGGRQPLAEWLEKHKGLRRAEIDVPQ